MDLQALKAELNNCYRYTVELHAHTSPVSPCSEIAPHKLVEIYKNLGFDAVTVTNHFSRANKMTPRDYVEYYVNDFYEAEEAGKREGIKVYFGAEIRFTENDNEYLIYGVNEEMLHEIYALLPYGVENFRKNFLMSDSVFILAHPGRPYMTAVDPTLIEGMEAFNMHPNHNSRIGLAALWANKEKHAIITAGSDFHHQNVGHEGLGALCSPYLPTDGFDLARLLRSGDYVLKLGHGNIVIP